MAKRKIVKKEELENMSGDFDADLMNQNPRKRTVSDVIDCGENFLCYQTPRKEYNFPEEGYPSAQQEGETYFVPEWMMNNNNNENKSQDDLLDAGPFAEENNEETYSQSNRSSSQVSIKKDDECYNMTHKNRGKCIVFNHTEFATSFDQRRGSNFDVERIKETFTKLGFSIEILNDLMYAEVINKIKELSEEDHRDNDCLCIFMLTHGLSDDMILAKDVAYKSEYIWKPFTADKCVTLAGKPKLFFFQACRGTGSDAGIYIEKHHHDITETDSSIGSYKLPTHADFLIAHCTVQGFFSWRNPNEGTWFIQSLCHVIDENYETMDLLKMLTICSRKIATEFASHHIDPDKQDRKQVPSITSMLIRDLYFTSK